LCAARLSDFICGLKKTRKEILEARFKTGGCGFMIAAAEVLCDKIVGKKLVELHGFGQKRFARRNRARNRRISGESRSLSGNLSGISASGVCLISELFKSKNGRAKRL
jgi:hypothetical protein